MGDLFKEFFRRRARDPQVSLGLLKSILALFTRLETRFVTMMYLQRVTILALVTISIVVALDISVNIERVMGKESSAPDSLGFTRVLYYSMLRASFVAPPVLLFAGVWGVVWAEYSLATSNERIMLFNSGKTYLPSLVPALIVGTVVGLLHFSISGFLKPATIEIEAKTVSRSYGLKFKRPVQSKIKWISGKDFILKARVEISEDTGLNRVYVFSFGETGNLERIVRAARARPTENPNRWKFHEGVVSNFSPPRGNTNSGRLSVNESRFEVLELDLSLSSLWLENFDILSTHLPQSLLEEIVELGDLVPNLYKYEMAIHERYASILYCIATVLLSAHLAMTNFKLNMMPYRALAVALVGYSGYFFLSITLMMGHHGYLPVLIAAWSIPLLITILSVSIIFVYVSKMTVSFGLFEGRSKKAT